MAFLMGSMIATLWILIGVENIIPFFLHIPSNDNSTMHENIIKIKNDSALYKSEVIVYSEPIVFSGPQTYKYSYQCARSPIRQSITARPRNNFVASDQQFIAKNDRVFNNSRERAIIKEPDKKLGLPSLNLSVIQTVLPPSPKAAENTVYKSFAVPSTISKYPPLPFETFQVTAEITTGCTTKRLCRIMPIILAIKTLEFVVSDRPLR